jgi:two-component system, NtrC family, C4-dicarboxylate transport sensor histidine kinase DctB
VLPAGIAHEINNSLVFISGNAYVIKKALETVKPPELSLTAKAGEGNIRISVADNGPGISEDKLSTIWEAFYTTKAMGKGTGLGLSIIKGIIEDHGGRVWAQHAKPKGACFIIELPFADTSEPPNK